MATAQTFTQNFSLATTPALPAGWMQNNVDGLTPYSGISAWNFGSNAWVTRDITAVNGVPDRAAHAKVAASTSYYTPAGTSNDWLISPSFTVPANAALEWEAVSLDPSYTDGYEVRISTTGTLTTDFSTTLLSVPSENSGAWNLRAVSLNTYSNQAVYIAFVNKSNDMFILLLDNIRVMVPPASDGQVNSVANLTRYRTGGSQAITGVFSSKGYTSANNATLNYRVNAGAVVTETINFSSPIAYGQSAPYSFTTPANLPVGPNSVKVWVSAVNGVAETNHANDTVSAASFCASQSVNMNTLIEEFSSSTCGPCAMLNANFDPLLNTNNPNSGGRVNVIKNQVNWPSPGNDPSYNPHSASRVSYYAINAAPTALINGTSEMNAHDQAEIDAGKNAPAYASISANIAVNGNLVSGTATVTPYLTIPAASSKLRVHQALLQKEYNFPGAVTSQKNYYHIMRKMFPDANGTVLTPTDGSAFNVSFTHTASVVATPAQGSFDFWNAASLVYEYVVFVQDKDSKDILQSGSAMVTVPVGVVELKDNQQIGVYPNPANDFAVLGIKLSQASDVSVAIYDISGKLVYSNRAVKVDAGQNEIRINTTEFATGTYNVIVTTEAGILKDKLIIVK